MLDGRSFLPTRTPRDAVSRGVFLSPDQENVMNFPQTMTMTRAEMSAIGLPYGDDYEDESKKAEILSDKIIDRGRWSIVSELIFRLPDMPDNLAYLTTYSVGATEQQDERPWEHGDAVCKLVHSVEKVIKVWEPAQG